MIDQVHNETLKLAANWLNALSVAVTGGGSVLPVITYVFGGANAEWPETSLLILCFVAGLTLHWFGQLVIGGLQSE